MGRTGGSSHSSHSSHSSSSHSHSSHSSSGGHYSGRSLASSKRSHSRSHSSPSYNSYHTNINVHRSYGHYYGYSTYTGGYHRHRGGAWSFIGTAFMIILFTFAALAICICIIQSQDPNFGVPKSTYTRERISGSSFVNRCVHDELGWIGNNTSDSQLVTAASEYFWRQTGAQFYLVMYPYSEDWDTADERYDVAEEYFSENIDNEDAILLVYFDAEYEDVDGDWELVKGFNTGILMDDEATNIFWAYLDKYWNDLSYSPAEAIGQIFRSTADRIMVKSSSFGSKMRTFFIINLIIAVVVLVVVFAFYKRKKDKESEDEHVKVNVYSDD